MLYNVQLDGKCENEFMASCHNIDHMFLGQKDLRLEIWHNVAIHISSELTHDITVDKHTFFPFLYQMLWPKYDAYVA